MRKTAVSLLLLILSGTLLSSTVLSSTLPPPPSVKQPAPPDSGERQKARTLYILVRGVNRRLAWDGCLALKALIRAKQLVNKGYFDHEDPATGKNPAWAIVRQCFPCSCAGENLAMGMGTAENVHKALMDSPTHRKNILDPRFSRIGIACYDYVCVELFAGF